MLKINKRYIIQHTDKSEEWIQVKDIKEDQVTIIYLERNNKEYTYDSDKIIHLIKYKEV